MQYFEIEQVIHSVRKVGILENMVFWSGETSSGEYGIFCSKPANLVDNGLPTNISCGVLFTKEVESLTSADIIDAMRSAAYKWFIHETDECFRSQDNQSLTHPHTDKYKPAPIEVSAHNKTLIYDVKSIRKLKR